MNFKRIMPVYLFPVFFPTTFPFSPFKKLQSRRFKKTFSNMKLLGLSIGVQAAIWNTEDIVQVRDCAFKVTCKRMNCGVLNLPPEVKAIKVRTVLPSSSWFLYRNVLLHSRKKHTPVPLLILGKQIFIAKPSIIKGEGE